MQRFLQQLQRGSSNRKAIDKIMQEMSHAKLGLIARVQLSLVGITHGIRDAAQLSVEAIKKIDKKLEPLGDSVPKFVMLLETHKDGAWNTLHVSYAGAYTLTTQYQTTG